MERVFKFISQKGGGSYGQEEKRKEEKIEADGCQRTLVWNLNLGVNLR